MHKNFLVLLFLLITLNSPVNSRADSASELNRRFFEAEKCAAALRQKPHAMKYRDQWLQCIEKYQDVYRKNPEGAWAPASLYHVGRLYLELFRYSRNPSDQKKGMELLSQVQEKFPESKYREHSSKALQKIQTAARLPEDTAKNESTELNRVMTEAVLQESTTKNPSAPASSAQEKHLKEAETCFKKLSKTRPTETGRRAWMLCIGRFHNAYLEDPEGPLSAQALYLEAVLYIGLHKGLKFSSDQRAARENFERIVADFPNSPFAKKAAEELKAMAVVRATPKAAAKRTVPSSGSTELPESKLRKSSPTPGKLRDAGTGLAVVQQLRYWSNPSYTRVVIHGDQEVDYNHHLLKKNPDLNKPPRLYVDLSNSTLDEGLQTSIPINDDLLSNARAARYTPNSVRVVVDIKSIDSYQVFSLRDPFRVVIDVWGKNGAPHAAEKPAEGSRKGTTNRFTGKVPRGALARQLALGVRRIAVDPGHGGKDFGAPGFIPGVHEKDVVLAISKRVVAKIRDDLGIEAILTRTGDRYLTLEERTAFANTRHADLFVSIHTNASRDPRAYGIETYFLNLATDDESIRVAAMENATSTKNISDLHSILNDLLKNAKINESRHLAELVQDSLIANMSHRGYDRIKDKGVKQAPFYVLIGARMPSILVETSFISNREECRRLVTSAYQNHLADSIVEGLRTYIKAINPTAFQESPRLGSSMDEHILTASYD
ncbi:MAG: N-acetylmuramoyl-L-alanine amidase [Desulfobacterales bacterium]|nr:N-acetylmuramoyl-L-alanine amidase [Desulfobacterales bacterium]